MSQFELIKDFRPQGHAYFKDSRGRVYIADCSGFTPADTDDGPLAVDFRKPLKADKVNVPLVGGQVSLAAHEEAAWLIENFQFAVEINARPEEERQGQAEKLPETFTTRSGAPSRGNSY